MTIKVYFMCSWGTSAYDLLKIFERQTPNNDGIWNNIEGTYNKDEADFYILQDGTQEEIDDYSKVIFFGREPKHVKHHKWDKECYAKFHHDDGTSWLEATWWINKTFKELENAPYNKSKTLSIIDSGAKDSLHSKRFHFINQIIHSSIQADIYGKINNNILPFRDKTKGLWDYKYSIAIENGQTDYYFSEKLYDCIVTLTHPLYYGATRIKEFFPPESLTTIDIQDFNNFQKIYNDLVTKPVNIEAMKEARHLVLYKYNLWPTIERAIYDKRIL